MELRKIQNNDESRRILEEDKLFRSDGGLNTAWIHNRAKNYDFSELDGDSLQEKLYLLYHKRTYCSVCGKPNPFKNWSYGYTTVCCPECNKIRNKRDMVKNTYGTTHTIEANERRKRTVQERYGCDNVFQNEEVKKTIRQTNLFKYGVDNPNKNPEVREKIKETSLKKYGVNSYTQTAEYKEKSASKRVNQITTFEKENDCTEVEKLIKQYGQGWQSLKLPKLYYLRYKFISNQYLDKIKKYSNEIRENVSHCEREVYEYCKELLPTEEVISEDRKLLRTEDSYRELDIYIPSRKVAIEYNGAYWHQFHEKDYHLNKTLMCEEKGVRLIHIWDDLWRSKKDIYKSIIASALGVYERRIYARKCECKEIDFKIYSEFLSDNHIQGSVNSSIRYGLFYEGELVQVAGWGKSRFKKGDFELHRMCTKLNTQVIGGFSKLIKHSGLEEFISYVDRDIYTGKGYLSCGFEIKGYTDIGYFYYTSNYRVPRINRMSAQKHKLKKLLKSYDDTLSETENMENNGYFKVYNCGNIIVSWKKTKNKTPQ